MNTHVMQTHNTNSGSSIAWGGVVIGILVALAGIVVLFWPGLSLVMLATIAGVFLIFAGIFDFVMWWNVRGTDGAGWTLLTGILDLLLGAMFLIHPVVAAGVITLFVGCFVIAYGAFAIIGSIGMKKYTSYWWLMLLNGIISLICGILFVVSPAFFALYLAIFLIMRGVTMSVYSVTAPKELDYF